jgi:glyoxylase-like metal-dependent hydrolase (beta-lactamase superfamily II)
VRFRKLAYTLPILALIALSNLPAGPTAPAEANAQGAVYSVWLVENCTFKDVPAGAFMPDRAYVPGSTNPMNSQVYFQLPVNVGIIKGGDDLILYDTGWKQQQYIQANNCVNWAPLTEQIGVLGFRPEQVTKIVIGHGHWDHAGTIDDFPNATLYVQQAELDGIQWALNYPNPRISETVCGRRPACGYPPEIVDQIYGKIVKNQAVIVDGEMDIGPGLTIHPAHRGHTAGSQLLQVRTAMGELMFGSDVYSSWEAIRDWQAANIQQTDTVQQFLAYEKCYKITGGYQNCVSAHEPTSYTSNYPLTTNCWTGPNGSRGAEVTLAPGESSRKPAGGSGCARAAGAPPAAVAAVAPKPAAPAVPAAPGPAAAPAAPAPRAAPAAAPAQVPGR